MAEIVQDGDAVLRKKAALVPQKDIGSSRLLRIIKEMEDALKKEEHGVALAAPQIGISLRLFIVAAKIFKDKTVEIEEGASLPKKDMVFINPELVRTSRKTLKLTEGCLSVRGIFGTTKRSEKATIRAYDRDGKRFVWNGSGLMAQIFQHEMEHLDGILFTDHAKNLTGDSGD